MCEHTRLDYFQTEKGMYDFSDLFAGVEEDFKKSDLVVANLETPLAGKALKYTWRDYQFNTPEEIGVALKNAGVQVVTTANNHVLDRGFEGLQNTLETLDHIGLSHTGSARTEDESKPLIIDVKGLKIGIISYTYGTEACYNHFYLKRGEEYKVNLLRNQELTNPVRRYFHTSKSIVPRGLRAVYRRVAPKLANRTIGELREKDVVQRKRLAEDIAYAKKNSQYVILCLHCGGQFNDKPTKYTQDTVAFCLSQGVDAIIGNHEHHIQGSRLSDMKQLVTFCLGNYTSNYGIDRKPFNKNAECSIMLHIYLEEQSGNVSDVSFEVLISVKRENGQIITVPLYNYLNNVDETSQQELRKKNTWAVNSFLGMDYQSIEPKKEYFLSSLFERGN